MTVARQIDTQDHAWIITGLVTTLVHVRERRSASHQFLALTHSALSPHPPCPSLAPSLACALAVTTTAMHAAISSLRPKLVGDFPDP